MLRAFRVDATAYATLKRDTAGPQLGRGYFVQLLGKSYREKAK